VVVACVAGVVAAVSGAANPVSAVQFLLPGHWVYNAALEGVFHVDGATGDVDARAHVPGDPGDLVVQHDTSGYVVGSSRITEFGKSTLQVEGTTRPASSEVPVPVETAGGPYLVYRNAGKVARLGDPAYVVKVGGPVGDPVATDDGVVWLPRTSAGLLCQLGSGDRTASCNLSLPKGNTGVMTVVGDRPMFVDTTADRLYPVTSEGLGAARDLRIDVPERAKVATTDVGGRVAILDGDEMYLVDAGTRGAKPVKVQLPDGDYAGPVSTGDVVAVVDRKTNTLSTFDGQGSPRSKKRLPTKDGEPRLTLGEDDRLYVDDETGEHVVVVDKDGGVTDVPITGEDEGAGPPEGGSANPPQAGPRTEQPRTEQPRTEQPSNEPRRTPQNDPPPERESPPTRNEEPPPPPRVPATVPGAPTGVTATAGNGTATVRWGVPPDNRSPITGYTVSWPGGSLDVPGPSATVPGLANGTSYVFTVAARNGVGTGPGASSNPVTPAAPVVPPSAPVNAAAGYDPATRTATLTWAPPANLGGGTLLHYLVAGPGSPERPVTARTATFPNLTQTGTLTFTVKAVTQGPGGQLAGPPASASVTVPTPRIHLSRGPATDDSCGHSPACAYMRIVLTGFPANTEVRLQPYSRQDPEYSNPGYTTTTRADGTEDTDRFAFAGVGQTVYVVGTLPDGTQITSNDVTWGTG
jgi:hypothetical protein